MMAYYKAYPHHVKETIDWGDGNFKAVPLAGAVGDSKVLPSLSTFLPVIVILFTPWVRIDGSPVYLSFACGEALSIRCIIGMPILMDMGPTAVDLASLQIELTARPTSKAVLKASFQPTRSKTYSSAVTPCPWLKL